MQNKTNQNQKHVRAFVIADGVTTILRGTESQVLVAMSKITWNAAKVTFGYFKGKGKQESFALAS